MSHRTVRNGAVLLGVIGVLALWPPTPVGATADGGASSRVVGRGDIVTSILGSTRPRTPSAGGPTVPPRCRWATLDDAAIEWVVAMLAVRVGWGLDLPLLDPLAPHLDTDELPDGDLEVQVCDGATVGLRFVPRPESPSTSEVLLRRMITRLPVPQPVMTPPLGGVMPLHHPMFVSLPDDQWQPIHSVLHHGEVTAEVEAAPVSLRVVSGDPATVVHACLGPGRAFDPTSPRSATRQAESPGACTVRYATANGPRLDGAQRPPTWIGSVTVLWTARWRTVDGPWRSLGTIPRTRLFQRQAGELSTAIESVRR